MHFKNYYLFLMVLIYTFTFTFQCSENVLEQVQNFSPNTPPEIISFTSDSPGAGLVAANQTINISFSATDLHKNTFTTTIISTQGLFGQRNDNQGDNLLAVTVPFTVTETQTAIPIMVDITLTDEKGATATFSYDLGSILPNVPPVIISATSNSPGGATLLPNQVIQVTVEGNDPHNDPIVFSYASLVGAFSGQVETMLPNGNTQSAVSFYISNSVIPGFIGDITITLSDNRGGITTQILNLGSGKLGPAVTSVAALTPFISSAGFSTLSFSADSNGFFQYTITNITGVNPVPNCSVNFASGFFAFYDMTLTPVINIDLIGSGYAGTASGAPFSLNIPAADGIYQVCAGVIDTLMQFNFLAGVQGVQLTQDSQPPVTSFTTLPASYSVATNVPVACSDNVSGCDISAYTTSTSTTPTPPAAPALPVIDPVTHTVTAGTLYSTPLVLADATQTTISALSLDLAGNAGALQTATYIVDTTVPVVAINAASTSVISSIAGYDIATLTWSTNRINLNYTIKSGTDCTTGTALAGLAGATPPTANTNVTNLINAAQLAAGANTIWVCVDNLAALTGSSSHVITKDVTPPTLTLTPLPGNFTTATNLVMNCTDTGGSTCAVTGYTKTTSVTPALPAAPATPALVAATKTVTAGTTQYTAPVALADATQTLFSYIAMDNVGNISTVTTTATPYIVETALPAVTVSAVTVNGVASTNVGPAASYNIATINWSTNRTNLNYTVKSGTCATGTVVANSTTMATPNLSGVTPATANSPVVTLVNQADLAAGPNTISICVTNLAGSDGFATTTINKDTTPPTISITPITGNYFVSSLPFTISCADNTGGSDCKDIDYYIGGTGPIANYTPGTTTVIDVIANGTVTHANGCTQTTYVLNYAGRDNAMNLSSGSASYTLSDCVRVNLSMVAPATYTPNSLSVTLTNATTVTSSGSVSIAATGLNTVSGVTFAVGNTYNIAVSGQPANQICSFSEKQFGTIAAAVGLTFNINCVPGYMVGGRYQALPAAPLDYRMYQGKTSVVSSLASSVVGLGFKGSTLYISTLSNQIHQVLAGVGTATVYAGTGTAGLTDGPAASAQFANPRAIISDGTNLYISQIGSAFGNTTNDGIRKIDSSGNVTTIATGLLDPEGMIIVNGILYFAEYSGHVIKSLDLSTGAITIIAGNGTAGFADNTTGTLAQFNNPVGLTALNGFLYVADKQNKSIRSINLATKAVATLTGSVAGFRDGLASSAQFQDVFGITTDGYDLYVSAFLNPRIRKIKMDRAGGANHVVSTIAGTGVSAANAGTGTGINGVFNQLTFITIDSNSLFVAEFAGKTVRKISDNGLVGYWPLNGTGGNANDYNSDNPTAAPGNINNGTSTAWPTLTASSGRYGTDSTYNFNGSSQFITATSTGLPTGNVDFTVSAWVKTQISGTGQKDILGNRSAGGQYDYSLIFENNDANIPGQITFARFDGTNASVCRSGVKIDDAKFHHLLGSKKGGTINLYVDGKLICQTADTYVTPITGGNLVIGSRQTGAINYFNGSIADVRIYNRGLNEGEINELAQDAAPAQVGNSYNTGATGLLSHYSFDGAANGGAATDVAPLGIPLTGCTWNGTGCVAASQIAVSGKDGDANGAYSYNGTSQYLTSTAGADIGLPMGAAPRTMCSWVNPAVQPVGTIMTAFRYGTNIATDQTKLAGLAYREYLGGNHVSLVGNQVDAMVAYTLPVNTWSHLCVTYSGAQTAEFYVNGQKLGAPFWIGSSSTSPLNTTSGSFVVGAINTLNNFWSWNGKVDDVRIYNNALTADQIRQLAVQVPTGLVARYDFTGDAKDVSGWGNDMTTNTATATADRFGQISSAYNFGATGRSMNRAYFSDQISGVTLSGWVKWLGNNTKTQILFHNGNTWGTGYGLMINLTTNRLIALQAGGTGFNTGYTLPVNAWSHVTATIVSGVWTVYVNGAVVYTGGAAPVAITTGDVFMIGQASVVDQEFNGDIDDVRVYNRALLPNEIQALVQQPNKRIFVTAATYNGDLRAAGAGTGIAGADAKCMEDANHPDALLTLPNRRTFKTMIVDGTNRRACTTANCATGGITENINWVLRPNVTYVRTDGTTPIFTADWNGVWNFSGSFNPWNNPVVQIANNDVWTGMGGTWLVSLWGACINWTSNAGNGETAGPSNVNDSAITWSGGSACNTTNNLYCVEQ